MLISRANVVACLVIIVTQDEIVMGRAASIQADRFATGFAHILLESATIKPNWHPIWLLWWLHAYALEM